MAWINAGRCLTILGMLGLSLDCLILRFLREAGASPWRIIVWQALFSSLMLGISALIRTGGPRQLWEGVAGNRGFALLAVLCQTGMNIGYPSALCYTSAANMTILTSLSPIWYGFMAWYVLEETLPRRTTIALVVAIVGVILVFLPSLLQVQGGQTAEPGSPSLLGDCIALVAGMLYAAFLTIIRYLDKRSPEADLTITTSLGSFLASLVAACAAQWEIFPGTGGFTLQRPIWEFWSVLVLDAGAITVIDLAMSIAPLYITGAEIGLLMLGAVIFGPLFVWAVYATTPPVWTFIGGGVLLATMVVHEAAEMFDSLPDTSDTKESSVEGGQACKPGESEKARLCGDPLARYT